MSMTEFTTSQSGYWLIRGTSSAQDIDSEESKSLKALSVDIFKVYDETYCFFSASTKGLSLKNIQIIPIDKYVADRDSVKACLLSLSYISMIVYEDNDHPPYILHIENVSTFDQLVTDDTVNSILFTTPHHENLETN
jgi:hypothetical protein